MSNMDGINSLLDPGRFTEPPEVSSIKNYIKNKYDANSIVQLRAKDIIVSVDNAALANSLRLNILDLKQKCGVDQKIIFKIGLG